MGAWDKEAKREGCSANITVEGFARSRGKRDEPNNQLPPNRTLEDMQLSLIHHSVGPSPLGKITETEESFPEEENSSEILAEESVRAYR